MRTRRAQMLAWFLVVSAVSSVVLYAWRINMPLENVEARQGLRGDIIFSHQKHSGIACLDCHHDARTEKEAGQCHRCHKRQSGRLGSKSIFHQSCIGCHEKMGTTKSPGAPVQECGGCHKGM